MRDRPTDPIDRILCDKLIAFLCNFISTFHLSCLFLFLVTTIEAKKYIYLLLIIAMKK